MKEHVYDSEDYYKVYESQKLIENSLKLYDPLKRLGSLLFWSVSMSLTTAIYQISVGLLNHWLAASISMSLAVITLTLFVVSLIQLRANISSWFDQLEIKQDIKEKDQKF